jgi:hypothetical protein
VCIIGIEFLIMASLIDIGSAVRELLNGVPTIVDGIRKSYESVLKIKDKSAARSDVKKLEYVSEAFGNMVFQPGGLLDQLRKYLAEPGSRGAQESLRSALNHSQEVYQECLKSMQLSPAFKARHPELMAQLGEYHWAKGRIITGIGDRIVWRADPAQIDELRRLEPLFDQVNRGIREVQREIADYLKELDRQSAESKSATHKRVVKET